MHRGEYTNSAVDGPVARSALPAGRESGAKRKIGERFADRLRIQGTDVGRSAWGAQESARPKTRHTRLIAWTAAGYGPGQVVESDGGANLSDRADFVAWAKPPPLRCGESRDYRGQAAPRGATFMPTAATRC
jgi:hypothetical protein